MKHWFHRPAKTLETMQQEELIAARQNLEHHTEQHEHHEAQIAMYSKRIARLEGSAGERAEKRNKLLDEISSAVRAQQAVREQEEPATGDADNGNTVGFSKIPKWSKLRERVERPDSDDAAIRSILGVQAGGR